MAERGIVVEFPSGRPVTRPSPFRGRGFGSVAGIARRLSAGRGRSRIGDGPDASLTIRLSELAGVGDETIGRLAAIAREGVITTASAARLALRHADECGTAPSRRRPDTGAARFVLTLAGDPFGRFAFELRGRAAWLVFASTIDIGLLSELCPRDRIQACLLIGCGAGRRTTVRLLTSADWRRRLAVAAAAADRCGSRHVLLLGGLPFREPGCSRALIAVEQAIRRGGNTELISSRLGKHLDAEGSPAIPPPVRELLSMIELAFPGLVGVPSPTEEPAR